MIWKRWRGRPREMPPLHWRPVIADPDDSEDYGTREVDRLKTESGVPRKTVAILACKNGHHCALVVGVETRFSVSATGVITPSVECPCKPCDGHEGTGSQLEGYGQP